MTLVIPFPNPHPIRMQSPSLALSKFTLFYTSGSINIFDTVKDSKLQQNDYLKTVQSSPSKSRRLEFHCLPKPYNQIFTPQHLVKIPRPLWHNASICHESDHWNSSSLRRILRASGTSHSKQQSTIRPSRGRRLHRGQGCNYGHPLCTQKINLHGSQQKLMCSTRT